MRICLVYSSQTGNTKKVANYVAERLSIPLFSVDTTISCAAFEGIILGFWLLRGRPDPKMQAFMQGLHDKRIFFFATHAAWVESEHVRLCKAWVTETLIGQGNRVLGDFSCQGRVHFRDHAHHPMTPERRERLCEAMHHPDADDCSSCLGAIQKAFGL